MIAERCRIFFSFSITTAFFKWYKGVRKEKQAYGQPVLQIRQAMYCRLHKCQIDYVSMHLNHISMNTL